MLGICPMSLDIFQGLLPYFVFKIKTQTAYDGGLFPCILKFMTEVALLSVCIVVTPLIDEN